MMFVKQFVTNRLLLTSVKPSSWIEKVLVTVTLLIVTFMAAMYTLPMIIFGEDFIFTIHDGLDSYPGWVQILRDGGYYFNMDQEIPFLGGSQGIYLGFSYNLYDFLNCMFGYLSGQICTRIIGISVGYTSMYGLLIYLFRNENTMKKCLFSLIAILYAIIPCAPNRTIGFAFLPLIFQLFLVLNRKSKFSKLTFLSFFIPFVSNFNCLLVFTAALWCVGIVLSWLKRKQLNINLILAMVFIVIATIPVNISFFRIALNAAETNRSLLAKLYASSGQKWLPYFKDLLLNGQYHAPGLHGYILLPVLVLVSVWHFVVYQRFEEKGLLTLKSIIIILGWSVWLVSALVMSLQESGIKTGILLIDAIGWGRMIALTRFFWCIMLGSFIDSVIMSGNLGIKKTWLGVVTGLMFFVVIAVGIKVVFFDTARPDYVTLYDSYHVRLLFDIAKFIIYILISGLIFTRVKRQILGVAFGSLLLLQILYVNISATAYNDSGHTIAQYILNYDDISMREFFSANLFNEIKTDIKYNGEWVAAYGYHPSVLEYNGFHTLDGYESVHSMDYQLSFREIIAPALNRYDQWKDYYDGWGGRMYLYGELPYTPWMTKEIEPAALYIDTRAFFDLGGRYILSRAMISNAEEIGLSLVKDYDRKDSFYHIYLYRVGKRRLGNFQL